ncbi:hypothetical protein RQP46_004081 [Phenoliferia psychrophenolica]
MQTATRPEERWNDSISFNSFTGINSSPQAVPPPQPSSQSAAPPGAITPSLQMGVPDWAGINPFAMATKPVIKPVESPLAQDVPLPTTPRSVGVLSPLPRDVPLPTTPSSEDVPKATKSRSGKASKGKRMSSAGPPPPLPDFKGLFARSMSQSKDGGLASLTKPQLGSGPSSGNLTVDDIIAQERPHLKRSQSQHAPARPPRPVGLGSPPLHPLPAAPVRQRQASAPTDVRRSARDAPEYTFDKRNSSGGLGIELPAVPAFNNRRRTKSTPVYGSEFDNSIEGRKRMPSMPNETTTALFPDGFVAEPDLIPTVMLEGDGELSALAQRTLHVSDVPRYSARLVLLEKLELLLGAPLSMYECEEIFKLGKSSDARALSRTRVRTSLMGMPPGAPVRRASFFGSIKKAFSISASDPAVQTSSAPQVVFGAPLQSIAQYGFVHTKFGGQRYDIPGVCFSAVEEIYRRGQGASIPGFFRNAGDPTRIGKLVVIYDAAPDYGDGHDLSLESVFDVSALLIKYLTDLPDPILDSRLWRLFRFACVDSSMPAVHRVACAQVLLRLLPTAKLSLLIYLVAFLSIVPLFPENANSLELMASLYGVAMMAPRKVSTGAKFQNRMSMSATSDQSDHSAGVTDRKAQEGLLWLLRNWGAVAEGVFEKELDLNMEEILAQAIPRGLLEPTAPHTGASDATVRDLTNAVRSPLTSPPASPIFTPSPAFSVDVTTRWGNLITYSPEHNVPRLSRGSASTIESAPSSRGGSLTLPASLPRAPDGTLASYDLSQGGVTSSILEDEFGPIGNVADAVKVVPLYAPLVQSRDAAAATRPVSSDPASSVAQQQKIDNLLRELDTGALKESPLTGEFDENDLLRHELAALQQSEDRLAAMERRCLEAEAGRGAAEENLLRITAQLAAIQGVLGLSMGVKA